MNNFPKLFICIGNLEISIIIGFIDEKTSIAKFDEVKSVLKETVEEVSNTIESIDSITNSITK